MSRVDKFLDLYKEIEIQAVAQYGCKDDGTAVKQLEKMREFRDIKQDLAYCRHVRNVLSHNPKLKGDYPVEPSEAMISLLETVLKRVMHSLRAEDVMIKREKLLCCSINDRLHPIVEKMVLNMFTHVPILNNGIVSGVFSESTLLSYLLEEEIIEIDDEMTFSQLKKYIPLDKHSSEKFLFVSRRALKSDIDQKFEDSTKKGDRIGLVFVTESGGNQEKLLGIITAWDLVG